MSALGGIFNFGNDPAPVDPYLLTSLGNALERRGPDGGAEACNAHIGMTYRAFHTTLESHFESQPLTSPAGHMLAWDGRLDNRDELIAELFSRPREVHIVTDTEIVLAAYLRWGKNSFVRLVGDFCLSLWDPRSKLLLLVRDVIGSRPLNYYVSAKGIVWATDFPALLGAAGIAREVDEEYVAGFLTRYPKAGATPYKNILTVKPHHVVTVNQDGQVQETKYWGFDPRHEIRYRGDQEYEDHFIHEFYSGLKAHLRSHRTIFSEASGGLDSSSIVCVGSHLLAKREVQAPGLETISYIYDESPTADESKFIKYVEQYVGRTGHHVRESEYPVLGRLNQSPTLVPNGVDGFAEYYRGVQQTMDAFGARVLLSGEGGDQMLGSNEDPAPELCDLLVQRRLMTLHRRLKVWSAAHKRSYLSLLWQRTIIPTLPRSLQSFCVPPVAGIPPWFNGNFVARAHLKERMAASVDPFGFRLPSSCDQSVGFISVVNHVSAGYRRAHLNAEIRYPYLHRPLVEFLQAIPFEQRVRPGETRSLMRRSLKTLLPDKIARRRTKGNPHEALCRAVIRELPRLRTVFKDACVSAYGYVDEAALMDSLRLASHGLPINFVALLKTISLEFWLRTLEQPQSFAEAAPVNTIYRAACAMN